MSLPHGGGSADGVRAPERAVHTSAHLNATENAGLSANGAGSAMAMLSVELTVTNESVAVSSSAGPKGAVVLYSGAINTTSAAVYSSAGPQGAGVGLRSGALDPQAAKPLCSAPPGPGRRRVAAQWRAALKKSRCVQRGRPHGRRGAARRLAIHV